MKLKEKIFKFTTQDGKPARLSDEKITIIINDNEWEIDAVFKKHDYEDGFLYGYSLLQYFTPEKGLLTDKEGHTVKFLNEKKEPLNIVEMKIPGIWDPPIEVSVDYIKDYSNTIGIQHPENLFTDLSKEEKDMLIAESKKKEDKIAKEKEDKEKDDERIADEKEKDDERIADEKKKDDERIADEKKKDDEQKLKDDLKEDGYLCEWDDYLLYQKEYSKGDAKEYKKDKYHVFYEKDEEEVLLILFKAGNDWFE